MLQVDLYMLRLARDMYVIMNINLQVGILLAYRMVQ